jgi:hypothetical protein
MIGNEAFCAATAYPPPFWRVRLVRAARGLVLVAVRIVR